MLPERYRIWLVGIRRIEGPATIKHRGKTVTKPLVLSRLELPLSEKQFPKLLKILKRDRNQRKLWSTPLCV